MNLRQFTVAVLMGAALISGGAETLRLEYLDNGRVKLFRSGKEWDFAACFSEQLQQHPAMMPQDAVKLAYQAACGAEHLLNDRNRDRAWKMFQREYASVSPDGTEKLFELISPDMCRINLRAWKAAGLPETWLFRMFTASAGKFADGQAVLDKYLTECRRLMPDQDAWQRFMSTYSGGAVRHSRSYHAAEMPSYRLVSTKFLVLLPVLKHAVQLPDAPVRVIVIDGRAGSGKTTLARMLAQVLSAPVVHMDDFFLPPELRTESRFAEPGGNIHYERFALEVLPFINRNAPFSYRVFDCKRLALTQTRDIAASPWRVVEGAYSMHPKFGDYAAMRIFYDIDPQEQMRRITKRNGAKMAAMFASRWIPFENRYISTFKIRERADIVICPR